MCYETLDLNNAGHNEAWEYFKVTGHPQGCMDEFHDKNTVLGPVDFDLEIREEMVDYFELDCVKMVEEGNGSSHILRNNDPQHCELVLEYYCDNDEFHVLFPGEVKYDTKMERCVFFAQDDGVELLEM